jgi:hypothetical protein
MQVRRPYLGEIVERATAEQYYNGFDCLKIGCKRVPTTGVSLIYKNLF